MKKLRIRKKKKVNKFIIPECLNCEKPLSADDVFCSYCGQKNVRKLNFVSFIEQLVSGFFSYDSRFWTTLIPIIFKPGLVSKNYIEGKRKRYVNPFQMYLQVSIVFFLILGLTSSNEVTINDNQNNQIVLDSVLTDDIKNQFIQRIDTVDQKVITSNSEGLQFSEILIDSTYQYKIKNDTIKTLSFSDKIEDFNVYQDRNPSIKNPSIALADLGYPVTFWNKFYFEQTQKMKSNFKQFTEDKGSGFYKKFLSKLSIGLFVFLPLFTLFFKLVYYRKHMNYMEHLVFVFHTQTVFFLLYSIFIAAHYFSGYDFLSLFLISFLIYLFIALKTFYNQSWFKTFVKYILINIVYLSVGTFAMIIISIIAFLFD